MKKSGTCGSAVRLAAATVLLLLLVSCAGFDIGDWPSRFVWPHNQPPANLCGSVGAFCAYWLLYYVGPGVFVSLAWGLWILGAGLAGRPVSQPVLRSVGVTLLVVAVSSSFYCLWPHGMFDFPRGSGGVLGVAVAELLRANLALGGTAILYAATWIVGLVLVADTVVMVSLKAAATAAGRFARQASRALWGLRAAFSALVPSRTAKFRRSSRPLPQPFSPVVTVSNKSVKAAAAVRTQASPVVPATPPVPPARPAVDDAFKDYQLPPLDILAEPEFGFAAVQGKVVKAKTVALERLLGEFNVRAAVASTETGPVVTLFELELSAGVKVSHITALSNDIARALGAGAVRVVAPLPGKHTIGIEVPNSEKEKVRLKDLLQLAGNRPARMGIPLFLGKDSSGEALVSDLTSMPHLLIAGTTGSGKSVCINSIIVSIMLTRRPDEVKMILIDPKMVEMTAFNTIPHLMSPIITETNRAAGILEWAMVTMDERYSILAEARVKNIREYNSLGAEQILERFNPTTEDEAAKIPKTLPYIVIVVDELADLMMTGAKEIEGYIVRLAQKSRAVGIHLVLATQRPQATVVTGLIKSNMPTRIGFRVAARMDSRIILDQNGAETLLGEGDMLFLVPGTSDLVRAQGTFIDEMEIKRIVKHLKQQAEPQFNPELTRLRQADTSQMPMDELFDQAVRVVLESRRGSVSLLQRRLGIGYARSSRIIESMAAMGVLGEYKGSQAREVVMTLDQYEQLCSELEQANEDPSHQTSVGAAPVAEGQRSYVSIED